MNLRPGTALKCLIFKCLCISLSLFFCGDLLAQPVITGFSPSSGPAGSTVTISGSGFDNNMANNVVYFGAVRATITAAGSNSLTVLVPGGAMYEPITVTSNNLTGYSNKPFITTFSGVVNQNSATSFSEAINVKTNAIVAVADLNNDTKPDLLGLGSYGNIPVWENTSTTGKVSFIYHFEIDVSKSQNCIVVSDLDGDGLMDITAGYNQHGLTVMKNESSGGNLSFKQIAPFKGKTGASKMFIRDMDGDGKPDIVTLNEYVSGDTSRLSVFKNTTVNGVLSFDYAYEISYVKRLQQIQVGDIDSDGKPDIVAINAFTNALVVFRNNSTAAGYSFTEKNVYTLQPNSLYMKVTDLDNDGKPEIIIPARGANYDGTTISILKNTSSTDISFGSKVDLTAGPHLWGLDINDYNGDGMADVAVANNGTFSVFYKNNINSISFASRYDYPGKAGMFELLSADIDGDNVTDIIGNALIVKNQHTINPQRFVPPLITSFSPASGPVGSSVTITGTGFSPVAGNNTVYFGPVKAVVTSASSTSLTVTVPVQTLPQPISVTRELLTGYSAKPFMVTFPGGEAPFTSNLFSAGTDSVTSNFHYGPYGQCNTDLDGDGKPDLVIAASDLNIYRNTGSAGNIALAPKIVVSKQYGGTSVVLAADMNGDGKPDLITNGNVYLNTSTPGAISFRSPHEIGKTLSQYPKSIVAGDYDGDGRTDLIMIHSNGAFLCRNLAVNDSVFFEITDYFQGSLVKSAVSADFSGDGRPDLALLSTNTKEVIMCRNTSSVGKISFIADYVFATGDYSYDLSAGDLDNDGRPDVAVVDHFDTTLRVYRTGPGSGGAIVLAGLTKYKTRAGTMSVDINDFNGDGKQDIAVLNYLDSSFMLFKNRSTAGTMSFDAPANFKTTSMPFFMGSADMDGDGLQDIIVTNTTQGAPHTFSFYKNQLYQPVITSVTPAVVTPGTTITINGYSFTNVTEVKLGSVAVLSFTVVSPNQITAVVGEGAEGDVLVRTNAGQGIFQSITFAAPVITSFAPMAAPAGAVITITGSNFSTVAANNHVYFGAVRAEVSAASTTSLTVKVPAGATTCSNISVATFSKMGWSGKPFVVTFAGIGNAFTAASFDNKIEFTAGKKPKGVAAGDVDGDGLPDLVVANETDGTVSILKNTGAAGKVQFTTALTVPLSYSPTAVAMVDINADGKPDVVIVDHRYGDFHVLINNSTNGNIALANPVTFTTKERANDIVAADFDGDGRTDLAIINEDWNDGLFVMQNASANGVISFNRIPRFDLNYNYNPVSIAVADMDVDGKPDLLVS